MVEFTPVQTVEIVDIMGSDETVARAARVSTGRDQLDQGKITGLIGYLARSGHTSCFEHCTATFRIEAPIFVARQIMRHRTFCLSGDSIISFSRPVDGRHYPYELERLYKNWNDPAQRARLSEMRIRSVDENTGEIVENRVTDVVYSGVKPMYRLTTVSGHHVTGSEDHRVFTEDGWSTIGELSKNPKRVMVHAPNKMRSAVTQEPVPAVSTEWRDVPNYEGQYEVSDAGEIRSWLTPARSRRTEPKNKQTTVNSLGYPVVCLCKNGVCTVHLVHRLVASAFLGEPEPGHEVRHLDSNKLNTQLSNLAWGSSKDNSDDSRAVGVTKYNSTDLSHIESVEYVGEGDTYDISVEGPNHNFFANGVVVHNSYSELSLRYTEAEPRFYIPDVDRPLKNAGSSAHPHLVDDDGIPYAYVLAAMTQTAADAYEVYKEMIETGVAQEVARSILPVSTFTAFYMTGNLNNWAKFLKLRNGSDGHPQHEIQDVAQQIEYALNEQFPVSMASLMGGSNEQQ